jgi:hypothetical protein
MESIEGVGGCFVNHREREDESGTLIRLTLRPGANEQQVVEGVQRVLKEEVGDRVAVPLDEKTTTALKGEKWQPRSQAVEVEAGELHTSLRHWCAWLALLLLACAVLGRGLLWCWQRLRSADSPLGD